MKSALLRQMSHNFPSTSALTGAAAEAAAGGRPQAQEDRILTALGLSRNPLPRATAKWQAIYYQDLAGRLLLPFEARCPEDAGVLRPWTAIVTVVELLPPSDDRSENDMGLKCKALWNGTAITVPLVDLEVQDGHPNSQLIEDYWYWFWNWTFDPQI